MTDRRLREKGTGTFEFIRGHWYVRVSLPDDTRPRYKLCEGKPECTCASMSRAKRIELGASIAENERARVQAELDAAAAEVGPAMTFKEFGEQWTGGKLHARWPDHVKEKRTSKQDGQRLARHIYPIVSGTTVVSFRLEDAERVMARLPRELSTATRRHVAQLMHRLLAIAVYPARLRASNPLPEGFMPKLKRTKAFTYLYPTEEATLMACAGTDSEPGVDVGERLLYGFLAREGMRVSEALGLEWNDLDLKLGAVKLDENKTDDPRAWALGEDVTEALRRWHILQGSPRGGQVFQLADGRGIPSHHLADQFRAALGLAKISRTELFERSKTRQRVRAHDLRGTFVTLALANGRTETWVADRTGHKSSTMINRYRRAARTAGELGLGWLAPLHQAVPELKALGNVKALTAG